jgi:hypothetical protein
MAFNRGKIKFQRKKDGTPSKGMYSPQNPIKYIGHLPILYRSSWEFAFCKFCDLNEKVIKWSAESLEIPYQITNKLMQVENHRYYPDFYVEMVTDQIDRYDRLVIEIKPKHETILPIEQTTQSLKMLENYEYALKTYKKNLHKWAFSKDWCERHGLKFIIITEDDLRKKGLIK